MAHIKDKDGNVIVDWKTEKGYNDRVYLFKAYRAFLKELRALCHTREGGFNYGAELAIDIKNLFMAWKVAELDIDDFPRISIEYPKNYKEVK